MHFSVVVFDELFDEGTVLVQDLVPHVRDVVEHSFVLDHKVLLEGRPTVHGGYGVDCVDDLDGDRLNLAVVVLGLSPSDKLRMGRRILRTNPAKQSAINILSLIFTPITLKLKTRQSQAKYGQNST